MVILPGNYTLNRYICCRLEKVSNILLKLPGNRSPAQCCFLAVNPIFSVCYHGLFMLCAMQNNPCITGIRQNRKIYNRKNLVINLLKSLIKSLIRKIIKE